jgi:hypothetical protein
LTTWTNPVVNQWKESRRKENGAKETKQQVV